MTLQGTSRFRLKLREIPSNYISNCSVRSRLPSRQVFFSNVTLKTIASSYCKLYREPMKCRVTSANTGINEVSLAHHIFFNLYYFFFFHFSK